MKRLVENFGFRISDFGFRNASVTTKFEIRNSKFAIPLKGNAGFTLIEVLIVVVLVGAVAGLLIPPFSLAIEGFVTAETRADLTFQAREATTRMVREIRNIQKQADDTPGITSADATSITFLDPQDNSIRFYLSAGTVRREDTNLSADNPLVDNVSSLQFRYFDGSNAELSPPLNAAALDNVRRILVALALQDGGETVTMTGQAFLRALTGV